MSLQISETFPNTSLPALSAHGWSWNIMSAERGLTALADGGELASPYTEASDGGG